jgi:hypothetical protein
MRLTFFLTQTDRQTAIRPTLVRLRELTTLPAEQWEICIASATDSTLEYIQAEFPGTQIVHGPSPAACSGQFVIPLGENNFPADALTVASILSHLDSDPQIGAVAGKFSAGPLPVLPTLAKIGASAFRKSVLERIGGLSTLSGYAADYDLTFRILSAGHRIDHRPDILFQTQPETAEENSSPRQKSREIADLLGIARRFLPENLSQIYWQDWAKKYKALASHAGQKTAGQLAPILDKWNSLRRAVPPPDPVSSEVTETVFGLRRHAAAIGDWARRGSVWRVILADFSDNLWAAYNACRSTGLQMRCLADNNPAYQNLAYRDLPIVPPNRAFEGGGIDGVILTTTDPAKLESNFKSLRHHFHGPILRLHQPSKEATHAQALAA